MKILVLILCLIACSAPAAISPTNLRGFQSLGPGDIRWFGASTNLADNSTAIQGAVDMLASTGGGTVVVPAGTFHITQAITPSALVYFSGAGMGSTVIYSTGTGTNLIGSLTLCGTLANALSPYVKESVFRGSSVYVTNIVGNFPIVTIGTDWTNDPSIYSWMVNASTHTLTLPDATTSSNVEFEIKVIAPATNLTIVPFTNTQFIDGSPRSYLTASNQSVKLKSNGSHWWIFAQSFASTNGVPAGGGGSGGGTGSTNYVISEDWEGVPPGIWSVEHDATAVNMANNTNVIEGTQSLAVYATGDGSSPPYVYNTTLFTGGPDFYEFFLLKVTEAETADDYSRSIAWIVDGANDHLATLSVHRVNATAYNLNIWSGNTGNSTTAATFDLNTTNAVWLRYQQGTGANAIADVWWTPYFAPGDAIKPANGSTHHAQRADGDYTTQPQRVQFGAQLTSGQGVNIVTDHHRVATTLIGDNPP